MYSEREAGLMACCASEICGVGCIAVRVTHPAARRAIAQTGNSCFSEQFMPHEPCLLLAGQCRQEITDDGDESGSQNNDEHTRKDEDNHRNDHLDRQLGGLLLGSLSSLHTQSI